MLLYMLPQISHFHRPYRLLDTSECQLSTEEQNWPETVYFSKLLNIEIFRLPKVYET